MAEQICPNCGCDCESESVDVGVGIIYGPWGCHCGWSEDDFYNQLTGPKYHNGIFVDQYGMGHPTIRKAEGEGE